MTLQETYNTIAERAAAVRKQEETTEQRLESCRRDKRAAEAAKAAALGAKDEEAYKEACRALADANAGIEFNSIVLRETQQKQAATEAEDNEIKRGLNKGMRDVYIEAINAIEKGLSEVLEAAETAMQKFEQIDAKSRDWNKLVMKDRSASGDYPFTSSRSIVISTFIQPAQGRLARLREGKKVDPYFKGET